MFCKALNTGLIKKDFSALGADQTFQTIVAKIEATPLDDLITNGWDRVIFKDGLVNAGRKRSLAITKQIHDDAIFGETLTSFQNIEKTKSKYFDTTDVANILSNYSSLIGIRLLATGGNTVTTYSDNGVTYRVHTFTSSGTFTVGSPQASPYKGNPGIVIIRYKI